MEFKPQELKALYDQYKNSFYIFDLDEFERNYIEFIEACRKYYPKSQLGYSYKTNYTPKLCQVVHKNGGLAEVVSEMEYELAEKLKVPPEKIIINGPFHEIGFIEKVLLNNSLLNIDSWYILEYVKTICQKHASRDFKVGIRFNFDISDGVFSRFGFEYSSENVRRIIKELGDLPNCQINGLHCHYSTSARSTDSYRTRAKGLIDIYDKHFSDQKLDYINIGGGFFSKMPESLIQQFGGTIPSYQQYAEAFASVVSERFKEDHQPTLLIEPGTAITANTMYFVTKVYDIKKIRNRKMALINASVHNIKPTLNDKNLPMKVLNSGQGTNGKCDFVGYTCMETDYVFKDFVGTVEVGDFVIFENVGAYTNVMKPPFIKPQSPILAHYQGEYSIAKRQETTEDIISTYIY